MLKNKLFGIIWIFVFTLPKFFPLSAPVQETPPPTTVIEPFPIKKIALQPKPIIPIKVAASVYFPVESQTDDTPLITADGSHIKKKKPSKHRWVAVSRNLLSRWGGPINYGDTLQVKGISEKLDGHYVVRDTMKKQIRNRIDILVGSEENIMGFWENVKIYHLN
jgi:3D (Asp-Asp-Asp) domain-containing protein